MPWVVQRPTRRQERLRLHLRRWRYDHSGGLAALGIGAVVVALTLGAMVILKLA